MWSFNVKGVQPEYKKPENVIGKVDHKISAYVKEQMILSRDIPKNFKKDNFGALKDVKANRTLREKEQEKKDKEMSIIMGWKPKQ